MHPQPTRNRRAFLPQKSLLGLRFQKLTVSGWTLASEKIEARLGGIYTLERLAQEALGTPEQTAGFGQYWTVMEILTAFVRENAESPEETTTPALPQSQTGSRADAAQSDIKPATDITAVLDVIRRRPETGRIREKERDLRFDLRATDLRGADLRWSDLKSANLAEANLSNAELTGVNLRKANLKETDLSGANLGDDEVLEKAEAMATLTAGEGHLTFGYLMKENWAETLLASPFRFAFPPADRRALIKRRDLRWTDLMADLSEASLVRADLRGAKLGGACLYEADLRAPNLGNATLTAANLRGADLRGADLSGADLCGAYLDGANLGGAKGDAKTRLPRAVTRPAPWPPETPDRL
jgi:uncharacterized protein YjbI with pentapeptide repeats